MPRLLVLAGLWISVLSASAQPYLVRDINTDYNESAIGSTPEPSLSANGFVYFTAETPLAGRELWKTDGTEQGTTLVADIVPGNTSSNPSPLLPVGNIVLLLATDAAHGTELWRTDGTAAGTTLVLDINPGPASLGFSSGSLFGNRFFFNADDGVHGKELWITDGTTAGTHMLADLVPGAGSSNPTSIRAVGNQLSFLTSAGVWFSDGTAAGTRLVKSLTAEHSRGMGNRLLFVGTTPELGRELWISDGTAEGTKPVKDVAPGPASAFPNVLSFFWIAPLDANRAIFYANDGLSGFEPWITDGSEAGTHQLRDLRPGAASSASPSQIPSLFDVNGIVFFLADDGVHGREPWRTDGTDGGTFLLHDVGAGEESGDFAFFARSANRIWFRAFDENQAFELWTSDGTAAGTYRVRTFSSFRPTAMPELGGRYYFGATGGGEGSELWSTDATAEGTRLVKNIVPDPAPSSFPYQLMAAGRRLFFGASESPQSGVWFVSDGTAEGTKRAFQMSNGFEVTASLGDSLFFKIGNAQFWRSDGTPETTAIVKSFKSTVQSMVPFRDRLYLSADDGDGLLLWSSDGTAAGTKRVGAGAAVQPGAGSMAGAIDRLFFYGGGGLSVTDDTAAGTHTVRRTLPPANRAGRLVYSSGLVYFLRLLSGNVVDVWRSDGTADGTLSLKQLPGGASDIFAFDKTPTAAANGLFFFSAADPANGSELWRSDGTAAGTILVKDIRPGAASSAPSDFVVIGDRLLFLADDGTSGRELWISDGTAAGTQLVADLTPGSASSAITGLVAARGLAYFAFEDALHGNELWQTDGTAAGTVLAGDIEPGPAPSNPQELTPAGERLFFRATTSATGQELWALPLPAVAIRIEDVRVREADGTARLKVALSNPSSVRITADWSTRDGLAAAGSDYTAASGSLTFEPGETSKEIAVPIGAAEGKVEGNETFHVRLTNVRNANADRVVGSVLIEDADIRADLVAKLAMTDGGDIRATITNLGPSTATGVTITFTSSPTATSCSGCTNLTLAAGESFNFNLSSHISLAGIAVQGSQSDPDPANNSATMIIGERFPLTLSITPAVLAPGARATLSIASEASTPETVTLTSSNPAVLAVPASAVVGRTPVTFDVTVGAPGDTVITATVLGTLSATLAVNVPGPGQSVRWQTVTELSTEFSATRFGEPRLFTATIPAIAPDTGAKPTGTVTFFDGARVLAVAAVIDGVAGTVVDSLGTGSHTLSASYSGDARFAPSAGSNTIFVNKGSVRLSGSERVVNGGVEIAIVVAGAKAGRPTGTVTVTENGAVLLSQAPLTTASGEDASAAVANLSLTPGPHTLNVAYSGDANYFQTTADIKLTGTRRRARGGS